MHVWIYIIYDSHEFHNATGPKYYFKCIRTKMKHHNVNQIVTHTHYICTPSWITMARLLNYQLSTRLIVLVDRCLSLCPFFFWPLCYLSFDLRLLITYLLSPNSSYNYYSIPNTENYSRVTEQRSKSQPLF